MEYLVGPEVEGDLAELGGLARSRIRRDLHSLLDRPEDAFKPLPVPPTRGQPWFAVNVWFGRFRVMFRLLSTADLEELRARGISVSLPACLIARVVRREHLDEAMERLIEEAGE